MSYKLWISIGETPSMSACTTKEIHGENIELVRAKMHAFVDERLEHAIHMESVAAAAAELQAKRDEFRKNSAQVDDSITSLTIGKFVGTKPVQRRSTTEGTLNLGDIV